MPDQLQALRLEVKKDKFEQLQNGTYKIQFTVHPDDLRDSEDAVMMQFIRAPMGAIFMMGLAQVSDTGEPEQPVIAEKPKVDAELPAGGSSEKPKLADLPRSEQMRRMCGIAEFQDWIRSKAVREPFHQSVTAEARYEYTKRRVKSHCGIEHSVELDPKKDMTSLEGAEWADRAKAWDTLLSEYEQSQGRRAWQRPET